jgi:hypothetical protein
MTDEHALVGDWFGGPEPAAMSDDALDQELAAYQDDELDLDDGYFAEYDDDELGPPGLPLVQELVDEADALGLQVPPDVLQALAADDARAQAYWERYDAEQEWAAHVAEQHELAQANAAADQLIEAAAARHDARGSAADGTIRAWANSYLQQAQREAFNIGDRESLEWLQSPQGAARAIDYAAEVAHNEAIKARALKIIGGGRGVV